MALLPPVFVDAVVALEDHDASDDSFNTVASGVLVGLATGDNDEEGRPLFKVGLVTCYHVFADKQRLWTRFNQGEATERYEIMLHDENGAAIWLGDERFDVAVLPVIANELRARGAEFTFVEEPHCLTVEEMEHAGIRAGDGIFTLGFPMGLAGNEKKRVIVRRGGVARVDSEVIEELNAFLIDATVLPGNSGGPVFNEPAAGAIVGTQAVERSCLIGIVSNYLPYRDVATSTQTGRPRVVFEENSGLASVVPFDAIRALASRVLQLPAKGAQADEPVQGDQADAGATNAPAP